MPVGATGCQPVDLAWSPDGDRLVVSSQTLSPGTEFCPAPECIDRSGRSRAVLAGHTGNVNGVDWSPDGTAILTASDDGTVKIWEVVEKDTKDKIVERLTLRGHSGPVWDAAWSPTGERVATASEDGTARVWDSETGVELLFLSGHAGDVTGVTWSPDGGRLATAGTDGTARVWPLPEGIGSADVEASGEVLFVLSGHGDEVRDVDWAPDGERIATIGDDGTARVWDAATGTELHRTARRRRIPGLPSLVTIGRPAHHRGRPGAIRVWDLSRQSLRLPDHGAVMHDAKWSPDGTLLATTCLDGAARIWDAASGEQLQELDHPAGLWRFAWSPDGTAHRHSPGNRARSRSGMWSTRAGCWKSRPRFHSMCSRPGHRMGHASSRLGLARARTPAFVFDALTGETVTTIRFLTAAFFECHRGRPMGNGSSLAAR